MLKVYSRLDQVPQVPIIAGFPGIGKTYFKASFASKESKQILDSDSSFFHWKYTMETDGKVVRRPNENFVEDYVNYVQYQRQELLKQPQMSSLPVNGIILVSTHPEVLSKLFYNHMYPILVYPDKSLKDVYLEKYKHRGDNPFFIQRMGSHWDSMNENMSIIDINQVILEKNDTLTSSILDIVTGFKD